MDQKLNFIARHLQGETISSLCKEFDISRTTGHKLIKRYKQMGQEALVEQKRTPNRFANKTPVEIEALILNVKREYKTWGAPKIREKIIKSHNHVKAPARSTIHAILDRHGLVKSRRKRIRRKSQGTKLTHVKAPNDLWCADYKGEFMLGNRQYCYPLTISDYASRYLISCESLCSTKQDFAFEVFTRAFKEYGLPSSIRTDNGAPFASSQSFYNLTKLSVWWLSLGINIERIKPGHPEQNGRHERMHLTLKQDTTRPPRANLEGQQEAFDKFIQVYNYERPHEGIKNKYPSEIYKPSVREFSDPEPIFYPLHDQTITVTQCGRVCAKGLKVSLSRAFAGQQVGIREIEDDIWVVSFMDYDLGYFDSKSPKVTPVDDIFGVQMVKEIKEQDLSQNAT